MLVMAGLVVIVIGITCGAVAAVMLNLFSHSTVRLVGGLFLLALGSNLVSVGSKVLWKVMW